MAYRTLLERILDRPIESNEYAHFPAVKYVQIDYATDGVPNFFNERYFDSATETFTSSFQLIRDYGFFMRNRLWLTGDVTQNNITYTLDLAFTCVLSGGTYYLSNSGGVFVWTLTPSIISRSWFQPAQGPTLNNSWTKDWDIRVPSISTTESQYVTCTYTFTSTNSVVNLDIMEISAQIDPLLNKILYEVSSNNVNSTVTQRVDGPLLYDQVIYLPPVSEVYDGANWVNIGDWGTPTPNDAMVTYPIFLGEQMLGLQDKPRVKYYGEFWEDIKPRQLFYYDGRKYLFTKLQFKVNTSHWNVTLFEVEFIDPSYTPIGPGNSGQGSFTPAFQTEPINGNNTPLTYTIGPNNTSSYLLPGVNYGDAPDGTTAARTIKYQDGYALISNKVTTAPPVVTSPDWDFLAYDSRNDNGWAIYADSVATNLLIADTGTVLTIDGLGKLPERTYLPKGATRDLWLTNYIQPISVGDSYNLRIDLEVIDKTANPASLSLELNINPGGTPIIIAEKEINTSKTVPYTISIPLPIFSLNTFVNNGGEIILTSSTGEITVGKRSILIIRTSAAV